ncbi:MAG: hypothetical protein K2Q18_09675 [Bdellovibrionales bacterium]|nr:hypothetical protein [Bdellovibrionales bacterium]
MGAAFFFSLISPTQAALRIAIVDTGFCSDAAITQSKNHRILPAKDMTETNRYDCKKITSKDLETAPRFHGQLVMNEFLSFLPGEIEVTVYPLVVYDDKGKQTEEAWRRAFQFIESEKMDFVLTASGFISEKKLTENLPSIWFVPSGRAERLITVKTQLFPQSLAPRENLFVIGDYYDGKQNYYDQGLLYKEQIDYYLPSGKKSFVGTSRAVAEAMGRALKECYVKEEMLGAKKLRACLASKEKTLNDHILKKDFKTF